MWFRRPTAGHAPEHALPAPAESADSDRRLLRRIAEGDTRALAELYDRHASNVFSLAHRILGDGPDAEAVVQDVFGRVWSRVRRGEALRGPTELRLLAIARRSAIDRARERHHDAPPAEDRATLDVPDPGPGIDLAGPGPDALERVRASLTRLAFLDRVAMELAYYDGLTEADIAARLEQPAEMVRRRVRTALLALGAAIEQPST